MNKYYVLNSIIDNIQINDNIDMRQIYNNSFEYSSCNKIPVMIPEPTLYRFIINEIRHNESNYEKLLREVYKINKNDKNNYMYMKYKNAVLDKISNMYPCLKKECDNQKLPLYMVNNIK